MTLALAAGLRRLSCFALTFGVLASFTALPALSAAAQDQQTDAARQDKAQDQGQGDAQAEAQDIAGIWEGMLKAGAIELRIAFHLKVDDDGKLAAVMDSIDQGVRGIEVESAAWEAPELKLGMPVLGANYTGKLAADRQSMTGTFEQAGMKMELNLKRVEKVSSVNRPQTPQPPFPYESRDVTFENAAANITLAGTLTIPAGEGLFPAVVLISGSGPQDRNELLLGHRPFLVIADHLSRHGIAVLRFDDRGVGKSGGDHAAATSADFATDAYAAVSFLKEQKSIDAKRIGLAGHSEGGLIGPIVAAEHPEDIAFVVMLAGPGVPGDEIIYAQSVAIARKMGAGDAEVALADKINHAAVTAAKGEGTNAERQERMIAAMQAAIDGLSEEERKLAGDENGEGLLEAAAQRLGGNWMHYFLNYDPRPTLQKVKCPVLAINGELDLQVLPDQNVGEVEKAIRAGGNSAVTTKVFPELNHLFQHATTGAPSEYGQIEETFAPEALDFVTQWILGLNAADK